MTEITGSDVTNMPGTHVSLTKAKGVAVFEDGRLANKSFVYQSVDGEASGRFDGYSTYTFENGDALNLQFTGAWSADGAGGDYEVLSGIGAFEGATGTGRFDAVPAQLGDGITLMTGWFDPEVP